MNKSLVDLQLKQLTKLCLASENYDKLASVLMNLISNRLNEIGIRLGIKPREKDKGESMSSYMEGVNSILYSNFEVTLFPLELLENLQYHEAVLTRRKIPLDSSKVNIIVTLIQCYYDLRKLDVPDIYQTISSQEIYQIPQVKLLSFLSGQNSKTTKQKGGITPLIVQKIRAEERKAENQLNNCYDLELFQKILQLKTIRKSLERGNHGKVTIKGSLKDNINYLRSKERLIQYLMIGWIILLSMLEIIILTQTIIFPVTAMGVSPYLLIILGACSILILLYRYYINTEGGGLRYD